MARFSGALTQGLMNPTYAGTLSQAAGMLGGLGGDLRQQRLTEERTSALRAETDPRKRLELMLQQAKTPQEIMQVQKAIQEFDQQAAQESRAQSAEGRAQSAEARAQDTYDSDKARKQAVARISMLEGERDKFKDNPKALDNINMVINRLAAEHGIDLAEREKDEDTAMPWSSVGKHLYNKETGETRLLPSETDPSGEPWDPNDFAQRIQKLIDEGVYTPESVEAYGREFKEGDVFKAARLLVESDVSREEANISASVVADASRNIQAIDDLLSIAPDGGFADATAQALFSWIPASEEKSVANAVETLEANIAFDRLQKMRDQSKTGGALGQVSEKELALLKANLANLDPTSRDFKSNLEKIKASYQRIIDIEQGPEGGSPNYRTAPDGTVYYKDPTTGLVYDYSTGKVIPR